VLPTLGQLGPITLHTYTLLINLGVALALATLFLRAPQGQNSRWLDLGIAAAVGAFLGARLLFAAANGDFYFWRPEEILAFWRGGLAWPGAVAGGLLGAWVYARRQRLKLGPWLDALAIPIAVLGLLGWGGCLAAGCAYGFEVTPGAWPAWLTWHAPDLYGLVLPRFPTQAAGLAWSLFALLATWTIARGQAARRWPPSALGLYALSQVALGAFLLSFTRGDPVPPIQGYRSDMVGSALVLVSISLAWVWRLLATSHNPQTASDSAPADSVTHT
jgi:phosphatidylglycerol---prolipoprotein diacylglyceryl transferase